MIWLLPVLIWSGTLVQNTWHCYMLFAWHWRQRAQVKSSFADNTAKLSWISAKPRAPHQWTSPAGKLSQSQGHFKTNSHHICALEDGISVCLFWTPIKLLCRWNPFLSSAACAVWSCTLQPLPIEGTHAAPFTAAAFEELSSAVTQKVDFCFSSSLYSSPGTEFFMQ